VVAVLRRNRQKGIKPQGGSIDGPGARRAHRSFAAAAGALLVVLTLVLGPPAGSAEPTQRPHGGADATGADLASQPSFLLLIADDQTQATFSRALMPTVFSELVDKGARFTRAYVETPLCCPARTQIMTGLYGTHNGVDTNRTLLTRPTIIQALHDLGYHTSLTGKYLNGQSCDPIPEFDQWVCASMPPASGYSLKDPDLDVNGVVQHFTGYSPDILADFTADFIRSTPADQPFFAMYTPTTPHLPADDPRCDDLAVAPFRPPAFDEDTEANGKPAYLHRGPYTAAEIEEIDDTFTRMTRAVACLDPAVGTILDALGTREQTTMVIYVSDNGYLYGQHRWNSKVVPYEESVRVPLVIRYPPAIPENAPLTSKALVQDVDLTATIAKLAGIHWGGDGLSLMPILTGQKTAVRGQLLEEWCQASSYPCEGGHGGATGIDQVPSYWGVISTKYVYVEYLTGEQELYDLTIDVPQLTNRIAIQPETKAQLQGKLDTLRAPPVVDTTIVTGGSRTVRAGTSVTFTYFSQSRFAAYECRVDVDQVQGAWTPCGVEKQQVDIGGPGDYVFRVRGTDEFGSTDASPAARAFTVVP
jgi:arylsulfatase A-like enzyme